MCVYVHSVCTSVCRCGGERKDAAESDLFLLCITFSSSWSYFFLFLLFFPACSPPLHQGKSSPGAEIQFRSSSSAFCALTCSDSECALSYLLPAQIERLGAGSSPCFHAVLSGCYSCVLRSTVRVYGRPGAAQQAQDH